METNQLIWAFFSMMVSALFIAPMGGYMLFQRKKDKETLDKLATDVAVLQANEVTEEKVKNIIHDHLEPVKEGQQEIKETVNSIASTLVDLRVALAAERGHTDTHNS